jgi:predicted nuclease of predicted toxin-antitoxin system
LQKPGWEVYHVTELGLQGSSDRSVYVWAQQHLAVVITYDEDFADARYFPLGQHCGVVRLRVWPTTTEATVEALARLLSLVDAGDLPGSLVIVDNHKIRLRRRR